MKRILNVVYFALSTSAQITFILAFVTAYFDPQKGVNIWINKFGEADFELVIIILLSILMLRYCIILYLNFLKNFEKEKENN